MFFNEDGDLAHEFYEEVKSKKKKRSKMKRVDPSLLRPQVRVELVLQMKSRAASIILLILFLCRAKSVCRFQRFTQICPSSCVKFERRVLNSLNGTGYKTLTKSRMKATFCVRL
jgi:hypothetical protein